MVYNEYSSLEFMEKAEKAKEKIQHEINIHKLENSKDSIIDQLENINKDIELMIISKNHSPSYPRMIVDYWDFQSQLGKELLELYELYKELGQ
ncbi:hypothetical protein ACFQ4N_16515 [Oceanobacillus iheyensis]|uniref:hypothetical protein n=1 Tax=Oceanobacillus iheyensis TaxID=182710 RepID=UPI003627155B